MSAIVGALASGAIPALIGAGVNQIGAGQRRRNLQRAQNRHASSRRGVEGIIGQFGSEADRSIDESGKTAEELYGDQIRTATDRIAANVGGAQDGIVRSTMAGGGDFSGRSAVAMLTASQQGNEAERDVMNQFEDRAEGSRRFNMNRADNLRAMEFQGQSSLRMEDLNELNAERTRQMQRRQAITQLFADLGGAAMSTFGGAANPGGA